MDKTVKKIKVRGTGCYDPETQKFAFDPFNEAPSTQTNVKTCSGGGKRWVTTGSDPSKMITLRSKESSPDQYSDFVNTSFTTQSVGIDEGDLKPKKPIEPPTEQRVVNEQDVECWLNSEKHEMTFTGTIRLDRHHRDWQAEVLRQVQLVVKRLPASERFNKVINDIKNGGNKS